MCAMRPRSPAPLLVLRMHRFLDEAAQLLQARLDDARDHALLDDRVTARASPVPRNSCVMSLRRQRAPFKKYADWPSLTTLATLRGSRRTGRPAGRRRCRTPGSTDAVPTGLRELEPLKATSAIESPRRCFAEISPMTQRTASMMFDLPHVGTDDADEVAGEVDGRRVHERLETGQLDLIESHRAGSGPYIEICRNGSCAAVVYVKHATVDVGGRVGEPDFLVLYRRSAVCIIAPSLLRSASA